MLIKQSLLGVLLVFLTQVVMSSNVQHVIYDKAPIHILLPLNQERMIRFPLGISIVDSEIDDYVGVMKLEDALYLSPHKAFTNKRLVVQLMPMGEAIVLTLSSSMDATDLTPIKVLIGGDDTPDSDAKTSEAQSPEIAPASHNTDINAVALTRFAIQSLYSPERLLVTPEGVSRTPMRTYRHVPFVYGASVTARPLISWRGGELFVTAIELKNELNKAVVIDPRKLLGAWQTAAFYPTNTLPPRGSSVTTTVFVTSSQPFGEALALNREFVR